MVMDPLTAMAVGGIAGGLTSFRVRKNGNGDLEVTPIPPEDIQVLKPTIVKKITLNMATARTRAEFIEKADHIVIIRRSPSVACNLEINEPQTTQFDLREWKVLSHNIWRFYITNVAGTGSIDLFICRGGTLIGAPLLVEEIEAGGVVGSIFRTLRTVMGTHFIGAIVQNATEEANLTGLASNKVRITGVMIQSDQQLDYRLIFFRTDGFADTTLDDDTFAGEVELDLLTYGFRIAGANQYYMSVTGLDIDYQDEDGTSELHVALQNLSATAKNAGATGQVVVSFIYEERD